MNMVCFFDRHEAGRDGLADETKVAGVALVIVICDHLQQGKLPPTIRNDLFWASVGKITSEYYSLMEILRRVEMMPHLLM
jgi:hypothetical protein